MGYLWILDVGFCRYKSILKNWSQIRAVKMKLTFPKIPLSLHSVGIFADDHPWTTLCTRHGIFCRGVMLLQPGKCCSVLPCTHKPLVLAHLPCGQPLSLFTVHHQQASTEDLDPCLEFCPANAHPWNSVSQALSLQHSLKTWCGNFFSPPYGQRLFLKLKLPFSITYHENHFTAHCVGFSVSSAGRPPSTSLY